MSFVEIEPTKNSGMEKERDFRILNSKGLFTRGKM